MVFTKPTLFFFVFPFSGKWDGTDELAWLPAVVGAELEGESLCRTWLRWPGDLNWCLCWQEFSLLLR